MSVALANTGLCMEEMVFLWGLERRVGFYQVKKSRPNIPGEENVINKGWLPMGCSDGCSYGGAVMGPTVMGINDGSVMMRL